jgi:hypothetical protein
MHDLIHPSAEAGAAARRPVGRPRTVLLAAVALAVWLSTEPVAASHGAQPTTGSSVRECVVTNGSYAPTCRMVPGHPDGWFAPNTPDAPTASARPTASMSRVR